MRRVAGMTLLALVLAGCSWSDSQRGRFDVAPAAGCPRGSEWPRTGDAAWLRHRLALAQLPVVACTGAAYVVRLRPGGEVYVWAFGPLRGGGPLEEDSRWVREVAGARVHGNHIRAVWTAAGRYVWVEAGPTAAALPRMTELTPLVAATVRRAAPPR